MDSEKPFNEAPKRPEGTPDHPFYHLSELPPEEVDRISERMRLTGQFFYTLAKLYRTQEYRLSHLDDLMPPIFPWIKSAKEEALDIGEVMPEKVLGWFQDWKADELKKAKAFQETEKAKGSTWDGSQRWVAAAESVTFEDAYHYGSFEVLQMQIANEEPDIYKEYFPKTVELMKKALEVQPKKLPGSPLLSSPNPPDIIEGTASRR